MSAFKVPIKQIRAIEPHPNADALEIAVIDGYRSVVKKGQFRAGDMVAYLPEGSVLPQWLLRHLSLWDEEKGCGKLAGKEGNRIKAVKLRGELSQGICYPLRKEELASGTVWWIDSFKNWVWKSARIDDMHDAAEFLGVTKYEPPVPACMAGEVFSVDPAFTLDFDVESWQSYPDILKEGEEVVITEQIHGTFTGISVLRYEDAHPEAFGEVNNILLFSKGLGAKGLVFKNNERNRNNVYVRATREVIQRIDELQRGKSPSPLAQTFILGETYGPGVQDLTYGTELGFRIFAVCQGTRGNLTWLDWPRVEEIAEMLGIFTVPVLGKLPFSVAIMKRLASGMTAIGGHHICEGVVVTPIPERTDPTIGRVSLKYVSPDYLTRKGGTEFN
jgi:RNA ligase (TIGR02306 family)